IDHGVRGVGRDQAALHVLDLARRIRQPHLGVDEERAGVDADAADRYRGPAARDRHLPGGEGHGVNVGDAGLTAYARIALVSFVPFRTLPAPVALVPFVAPVSFRTRCPVRTRAVEDVADAVVVGVLRREITLI